MVRPSAMLFQSHDGAAGRRSADRLTPAHDRPGDQVRKERDEHRIGAEFDARAAPPDGGEERDLHEGRKRERERHFGRRGLAALEDREHEVGIFEPAEHRQIGDDAGDQQPPCRLIVRAGDAPCDPEIRQDREHRQQHEGRPPPGVEGERRDRGGDDRSARAVARENEMECDRRREKDENELGRVKQHQVTGGMRSPVLWRRSGRIKARARLSRAG